MAYVLGSNIYEASFLDELYIYQGQPHQDSIPYKNDLTISPIKLDKFNEFPIKRNERSEIALKIIETGLQYLEYPILFGNTIINPFEINIRDNVKSIPSMKFQLIERENISFALDVRKLYFSVNSCGNIIKEMIEQKKDFNKYFYGKMVKCRYNDKQMLYRVKNILFDQEIVYKNQTLQDYYKRKYKLNVNSDYILETDNTKSIKTQFLLADLCDLQYDFIEQDCTLYCQQLQYWNEIINANQNFLSFLKKYKLIIQGNTVDFKMQYLDSGTAIFANNVYKSFSQLVQARTQSEFTHFYADFFLKQNVIFSTNLQIENLIILVQRDTIKDREQFRQFYDKFKFQILQKQYQIHEPLIIDINNNLQELISEYGKPENYIFLIGDQDYKQEKFQLLSLGVPVQIILLPVIDQEINRIFAIMAATKGSTPWQLKELGGYLNNRRRAFMGIYQNGNSINCSLSMNKSQTKYISSFGELSECLTILIGTYYATHKHLPDIIVVFGYQQYNIEECLPQIINLIKQQYSIDILYQPEIYKVMIAEQSVIRYFTHYERSMEARFCRNAGTGMIVNLNEKKGQYQLHTLRRGQGCPLALDIQISGCPQQLQREIIETFYQLIYLCYDYNSQTYLPAPLHYAKLLSYYDHLENEKFKQQIQKGNLLFI